MSFRGKLSILVVSVAVALYAVVGGMLSPWTRAQQPINDSGAQMRIFESVLQHIQNDYVDEPNMDKVRVGALRGLAGGLDMLGYLFHIGTSDVQASSIGFLRIAVALLGLLFVVLGSVLVIIFMGIRGGAR